MGIWSSGMILALGARGPEQTQNAPPCFSFQMLRLKFFLVSVMELHNYKFLVHFPTNKLLPEIN
uniref:Uncharacterized protein n=1 Tax=Manihot esculenta TaxID=3983 RepID=A0A2C9V4H9_MANES